MAYEYNLPVLASPNSFTLSYVTLGGTDLIATSTLSLSSTPTYTTGFSSVGGVVNSRLGITLGGTTLSALSASTSGISLSVLNNIGNVTVYGYILSSTWNPVTSAYAAVIAFSSPQYIATSFTISGFATTVKFLTGARTPSVIDNTLIAIPNTMPRVTIWNRLSSINVNQFRTVSRQTRLVQGEY